MDKKLLISALIGLGLMSCQELTSLEADSSSQFDESNKAILEQTQTQIDNQVNTQTDVAAEVTVGDLVSTQDNTDSNTDSNTETQLTVDQESSETEPVFTEQDIPEFSYSIAQNNSPQGGLNFYGDLGIGVGLTLFQIPNKSEIDLMNRATSSNQKLVISREGVSQDLLNAFPELENETFEVTWTYNGEVISTDWSVTKPAPSDSCQRNIEVQFKITDQFGNTAEDTFTFKPVHNKIFELDASLSTYYMNVKSLINLDASEHENYQFLWNTGDGHSYETLNFIHTYENKGDYTLTLSATNIVTNELINYEFELNFDVLFRIDIDLNYQSAEQLVTFEVPVNYIVDDQLQYVRSPSVIYPDSEIDSPINIIGLINLDLDYVPISYDRNIPSYIFNCSTESGLNFYGDTQIGGDIVIDLPQGTSIAVVDEVELSNDFNLNNDIEYGPLPDIPAHIELDIVNENPNYAFDITFDPGNGDEVLSFGLNDLRFDYPYSEPGRYLVKINLKDNRSLHEAVIEQVVVVSP